jgi:protein TonB
MCLALAAFAVMSGFGERVAKVVQEKLTFVHAPPTPSDPPEPVDQVEKTRLATETELVFPEVPIPPLPSFIEQPPLITVTASTGDAETGASVAPPPAPVRKWPVMRTTEKPPYPPGPVRLKQEGVTGLSLCVGANGRVTQATLASSSGVTALDEAALKWIRNVRFSPGTLDGVTEAMCGHRVTYEWRLEGAR